MRSMHSVGRGPVPSCKSGQRRSPDQSKLTHSFSPFGHKKVLCNAKPTDTEQTGQCQERQLNTSQRTEAFTVISEALQWTNDRPYRIEGVVNNVVEHRRSLPKHLTTPEEVIQDLQEVPLKKSRGRPKGYKAWNKGVCMPEKTKLKIAASQRQRWQNSSLRAKQRQIQRGNTAWNKGLMASTETRQKMSAARRYTVLPRNMTYKMSQSHKGLTHTAETRAIISEKLRGKAKSEDHKRAIAAGQRRRFAAKKLYNYVQACDNTESPHTDAHEENILRPGEELGGEREDIQIGTISPVSGPAAPNMYSTGDPFKSRKKHTGKVDANEAIVQDFVSQLREFRTLQRELAPWTDRFKIEFGRRPRFEDVQKTGINWLVEKFEEYVSARQTLLCESSQLRSKLENKFSIASEGSLEARMNSNSSATASMCDGAKRMAKALEYKQNRETKINASQILDSVKSLTDDRQVPVQNLQEERPQATSEMNSEMNGAALESHMEGTSKANFPETHDERSSKSGETDSPSVQCSQENMKNLAGASPRVRAAMLAAAKYKKQNKSP